MGRKKRVLFDELMDGVAAMAAHREGKLTLRTHRRDVRPLPPVTATLIRNTRERLKMSQGVFARKLRVNPRTLERWRGRGGRRPSSRIPRRWISMALPIRRSAASMVLPVATQPGRSGTDAPQSLSRSLLIRTRYCTFLMTSLSSDPLAAGRTRVL